jgi:hypothetical protein
MEVCFWWNRSFGTNAIKPFLTKKGNPECLAQEEILLKHAQSPARP